LHNATTDWLPNGKQLLATPTNMYTLGDGRTTDNGRANEQTIWLKYFSNTKSNQQHTASV